MTAQDYSAETGGRVEEGPTGFLGKMAESIGVSARNATIYGEPVTNGGVTVITVAKARWGFGGGGGGGTGSKAQERKGSGEGAGGGGGSMVSPLGYIEITEEGARFRRIWDAETVAMLAVCGGFALVLVLRSVRKLVR
jgi:uncharacterized spore protein YtfJ